MSHRRYTNPYEHREDPTFLEYWRWENRYNRRERRRRDEAYDYRPAGRRVQFTRPFNYMQYLRLVRRDQRHAAQYRRDYRYQ